MTLVLSTVSSICADPYSAPFMTAPDAATRAQTIAGRYFEPKFLSGLSANQTTQCQTSPCVSARHVDGPVRTKLTPWCLSLRRFTYVIERPRRGRQVASGAAEGAD
jgi:hypothetical protein